MITTERNHLTRPKRTTTVAKVIIGGVSILLVVGWFIFTQVDGSRYRTKFFHEKFSATIMGSNSYYGRSVEFHLSNGFTIYFMPPIDSKIAIGDSVQKNANSYLYNVYRKNSNDVYNFLATYNYMEIQ